MKYQITSSMSHSSELIDNVFLAVKPIISSLHGVEITDEV